jgi:hypothetical protein
VQVGGNGAAASVGERPKNTQLDVCQQELYDPLPSGTSRASMYIAFDDDRETISVFDEGEKKFVKKPITSYVRVYQGLPASPLQGGAGGATGE